MNKQPTDDPHVRRMIHALASRVVGPRTDWEFIQPQLETILRVSVNDHRRIYSTDCSGGFATPQDEREWFLSRIADMQAWDAQVQGEPDEPDPQGSLLDSPEDQ